MQRLVGSKLFVLAVMFGLGYSLVVVSRRSAGFPYSNLINLEGMPYCPLMHGLFLLTAIQAFYAITGLRTDVIDEQEIEI